MLLLSQRRATKDDLAAIVSLLAADDLGQTREHVSAEVAPQYIKAFTVIAADPNQYLMVVLDQDQDLVVATCHLTLMPSLTFQGSLRMQIEAVRVAENYRGQKIGQWMMQAAMDYAKQQGVKMVQLTTNQKRPAARRFYESLGFIVSHEGMKLVLES
jgi:GNAT superfamily N-acetyltransferase